MKILSPFFVCLACWLLNSTFAEAVDATVPENTDNVSIEASIMWDFNQDGVPDAVTLEKKVDADDNQSLNFYLGTANKKNTLVLAKPFPQNNFLYNKNPPLSLNPKKNLVLNVGDSGVGRNHYQNQYVIRYDKKEFYIIGIKFYIFSQEDGDSTCDINLLNHEGVFARKGTNKKFKSDLDLIKVADFDFIDSIDLPKTCKTR